MARQREARARLFAPGRRQRRAAGARPAPTRGARGRSSGSSTPSTTAAWSDGLKYVAWRNNTFSAPRARGRPRRRPGGRRVRPPARRCCPSCWRCRRTRRSWTGATRACTRRARQIFTKSFPRCGIPEPFGELRRLRRLRGLPGAHELDRRAHPALVERAAAPRLRHRGGPHLRRPDRAPRTSTALAGLITACVAQAAIDYDERRALRAAARAARRGELLARHPLRPGRQADRPRARRRSSRRRRSPTACWPGPRPRARALGHRRRRCRRRAAPSASAGRCEGGASIEEVFARRGGRDAAHLCGARRVAGERADEPAASRPSEEQLREALRAAPGRGRGPPDRGRRW